MNELSHEELALLEEAAGWRLIGLVLERPRGDWAETIRAIAAERAVDRRVALLCERATFEATEATFLAVFGPGGGISPREVSYREDGDPGEILAEIKSTYDAFAFVPQTEEPPDHVSVEACFVGFLRLKEAYARMMGNNDEARRVREASSRFVAGHLAYLASGLAANSIEGYLRDAIEAVVDRVGSPGAPVPASRTRHQ